MVSPFDLEQATAYRRWRDRKLAAYPAALSDLRVPIERLGRPTARECTAIRERIRAYNLALIQADPADLEPTSVIDLARALGLRRTDANLLADARAISRIAAHPSLQDRAEAPGEEASSGARHGDFIPYTDRPLGWHTDGYYNAADAQVGAWCLFCVRPARRGGENHLLDHEIAYLRLRDATPDHVAALAHPQTLTIPAHLRDGQTIRPERVGPVFSIRDGALHMRYSARGRNIQWRNTPETEAARQALDRLFSLPDVFTFSVRLEAGEGLISNNVPHCRSGFEDCADPNLGRLLYRLRFVDRIRAD